MPYAEEQAPLDGEQLARVVVTCAESTLATTGVRIEFRQDWHFSRLARRKRRRRGGVLSPVGKLATMAVKAAWNRATRDLHLGHMHGMGILDPSTGRLMIDFGSFAQVHTDGKTFGGRSGRCLATLDPFPDLGNTADMFWLLRLLRGITTAAPDGEEILHRMPCTRIAGRADLEKASAATPDGLRVPATDRFEHLHDLPVTVWIDGEHVRRIEFDHPSSQHLTVDLWDYGVSTGEYDWSRLPTFRSLREASYFAGEDPPWHRRLRGQLRRHSGRAASLA